METKAVELAKTTKPAKPKTWDEYFPLLNKAMLGLLVVGGLLIFSGGNVKALLDRSKSGDAISVSSDSSFSTSGSKTGRTWQKIVMSVGGVLGVVVVVLTVMSFGGRDAARAKEQLAAHKKECQPKTANASDATSDSEPECNLASYRLLNPPAPEPSNPLEHSKA